MEELYQVCWRPTPVDQVAPFGATLPPSLAPVPSVTEQEQAAPKPVKVVGAYRPPGARGLAAPAIFKREDEGGTPSTPGGSGASTPQRGYSRSLGNVPGAPGYQNGGGHSGEEAGSRGSAWFWTIARTGTGGQRGGKGNKKRKGKKDGEAGAELEVQINGNTNGNGKREEGGGGRKSGAATLQIVVQEETEALKSPTTPGVEGALDAVAKKARNLNKKLKVIEELKEKAKRGERLEVTQLKKMEGEGEIKKVLAGLGVVS